MLSAGYQTRYPIVAVYTVVVVVVPFLFCFVDFSFSHSFLFVSYVFSLLMDYRDSSSLLQSVTCTLRYICVLGFIIITEFCFPCRIVSV